MIHKNSDDKSIIFFDGDFTFAYIKERGQGILLNYSGKAVSVKLPEKFTVTYYVAGEKISSDVTEYSIGSYAFNDGDISTCHTVSVDLGNAVTGIGEKALGGIRSCIFGDSVEQMDKNPIYSYHLKYIVIGKKALETGTYPTTYGCEKFYFRGSEADWLSIDEDKRTFWYTQIFWYSEEQPEIKKDEYKYYWHFNDNGVPVEWSAV